MPSVEQHRRLASRSLSSSPKDEAGSLGKIAKKARSTRKTKERRGESSSGGAGVEKSAQERVEKRHIAYARDLRTSDAASSTGAGAVSKNVAGRAAAAVGGQGVGGAGAPPPPPLSSSPAEAVGAIPAGATTTTPQANSSPLAVPAPPMASLDGNTKQSVSFSNMMMPILLLMIALCAFSILIRLLARYRLRKRQQRSEHGGEKNGGAGAEQRSSSSGGVLASMPEDRWTLAALVLVCAQVGTTFYSSGSLDLSRLFAFRGADGGGGGGQELPAAAMIAYLGAMTAARFAVLAIYRRIFAQEWAGVTNFRVGWYLCRFMTGVYWVIISGVDIEVCGGVSGRLVGKGSKQEMGWPGCRALSVGSPAAAFGDAWLNCMVFILPLNLLCVGTKSGLTQHDGRGASPGARTKSQRGVFVGILLGTLVVIASIFRAELIVQNATDGKLRTSLNGGQVFQAPRHSLLILVLSLVEPTLALMCCCLPGMRSSLAFWSPDRRRAISEVLMFDRAQEKDGSNRDAAVAEVAGLDDDRKMGGETGEKVC